MGLVHSGILSVLPNVELVALCEKNRLIRRLSKRMFKECEIIDDVEKLAGLSLDAVYVTTPIPSHFPVAGAILEKKISKNVFVEKTLAQTYAESKHLTDLAESRQGVTMVGYLRRFYVTFRKAKGLLQDTAIGEVKSFKSYAYSSDFFGLETETKASSSRGGLIRDLGCHAIDLALWFFGNLKVISSESRSGDQGGNSIGFRAEGSEVSGDFDVSWRKEDYRMPDVGFLVNGSKGNLFVNDDQVRLERSEGKVLKWYRHDLNDSVPFWLALPEYYREDLHFAESVAGGMKATPDFCSAKEVDKIIDDVVGEKVKQD